MRGINDALIAAGDGYRVFPVGSDKKPLIKGWVQLATTDRDTLERWWKRFPHALVGIATGHGLVVVDLDVREGLDGPTEWRTWCAEHNVPPMEKHWLRTRSEGSRHLFLRTEGAARNAVGLLPGVDVKGDGGYVVAWNRPAKFEDLPAAPDRVEALLSAPEKDERPTAEPIGPERLVAAETNPKAAWIIADELKRLIPSDELNAAGWDNTAFEVACNLIQIANTPELGYSLERAHADFVAAMPTDPGFTSGRVQEKWDSALGTVKDKDRPDLIPNTDASNDFGTWDEPEAQASETVALQRVAADLLRALTDRAKLHMQAQQLARQELRDAETPLGELPSVVGLDAFLDEPDEPMLFRIQKLWPTAGRVVLVAQYKAGKTTLVGNVVRSLVDGDPFLDQFLVGQADRVLLADNEMSPGQLRGWLRDQKTRNPERVGLLSLRGKVSSFNILDETIRQRWASHLGPADVLIFDCLRPVLDALGLDENKDAGKFLVALDELAQLAGIKEVLLVHHMGHMNERSRGDSRILDWPDATWNLVQDAAGLRYLSARGRDVEQPEIQLDMEPTTRHLSVVGGSRAEQKHNNVDEEVLTLVDLTGPQSGRELEKALGRKVRPSIKRLVASGQLKQNVRKSQGGGNEYTV